MAWLFGKKQTKAINSKAKVANKEVMQAIQDLENYKFDLQANISWWYNGANKESLARQLNDYSTGQLKRLEQWVERFNEAISILKDNQYSKLCDIKTENATIRSIIAAITSGILLSAKIIAVIHTSEIALKIRS